MSRVVATTPREQRNALELAGIELRAALHRLDSALAEVRRVHAVMASRQTEIQGITDGIGRAMAHATVASEMTQEVLDTLEPQGSDSHEG